MSTDGPPGRVAERRLALGLLLLVLLVGSALRFVDLGAEPFFEDDLNHVSVARALEAGAPPALPSGVEYTRALDFTRMVQLSLRLAPGDEERAARLPAAVFGVLGLVLVALIAWRIAGPWAAVWTTILFAFFPDYVAESRRVRFYTYQTAWMLVALYAAWEVVRHAGRRAEGTSRRPGDADTSPGGADRRPAAAPPAAWWRNPVVQGWAWAGVAGLAFLAATRVQFTTFTLLGTFAVVVAFAAAADLYAMGRAAWRGSVPVQLAALGGVALVGVAIKDLGGLLHLGEVALCVGSCEGISADPRHYYWELQAAYPLLVSLAPLAFLAVGLRHPRLALFLLLWFAIPFLLHSFVFPRQAMRYLLGPLPALFLAGGIAAAMGAGLLRRTVRTWASTWTWTRAGARRAGTQRGGEQRAGTQRAGEQRRGEQRGRELLAIGVVGIVAVGVIVTTPGFNESRKVPSLHLTMDWEAAGEVIREADPVGAIPLGSGYTMQPLHYWGRLDFSVATDFLVRSIEGLPPETGMRAETGPTELEPYTGRPILSLPSEIRAAYPEADAVLVVVDENKWTYGDITAELKRALDEEATELCRGRCAGLSVFLWHPHAPRAPRDTPAGSPPGSAPD